MSGILSGSKGFLTHTKRAVLFLTAILLSVSLFSPLLNTEQASAAAPYSSMSLDDLNKSTSYYVTLQTCVSNNMKGTITAGSDSYSPTSIDWFDDNEAYGYIYPDGKTDCRDIMAKALSLWNVSAKDFLAGMKYTQPSKTSYNWSGTKNGDERKNNFIAFVKSAAVTNTSDPNNPGGAAAYLRYDYWWDNNCVVKAYGKMDSITDNVLKSRITSGETASGSTETGVGSSGSSSTDTTNKYASVTRVDNIKWGYLYKYKKNSTLYDYIAYGYHGTASRRITCEDTAKALAQYAPAYNAYLDKAAATEACKDKGYSGDALAACENGRNAKVTGKFKTFCNTYAGGLKDACNYGFDLSDDILSKARSTVVNRESTKQSEDGNDNTTGNTCGIDGLGWIICPAMSFMGDVFDDIFKGLADNFLNTDIELFNTGSGTFVGWGVFRSIANIAFVIAFLVIIFSQLTGVGVSNYGVKKMLPRLVIAAILVNISFFVCQLAVDVSNVLGYSLKSAFEAISATISSGGTASDATANGLGISALTLSIIGASVVSYFALGLLIPVLLSGLVAVIMVILLLILRKALIVLLIVISPLAFVAYLLPNTENLFTKWRKLFTSMLLLFPVVAVVFGASTLASQILLTAQGSSASIKIAALAAVTLPLFVIPALLKSSLNAAGNIGAKINNMGNKAGGALGKAGNKGFANSRLGQYQQFRKGKRSVRRAQIRGGMYEGENRFYKMRSNFNEALNDRSGEFGNRVAAVGISAAEEEKDKETKAAATLLNARAPGKQELRATRKGNKQGSAMNRAAVERIVATNDITGINEMIEESHTWSQEDRVHFADTLGKSSNRPGYVGQGTLAKIREGNKDENGVAQQMKTSKLVESAVKANAYSASKIAGTDADELTFVAKTTYQIGGETHAKIATAAQEALTDERIAPTIGKNKDQVDNLARLQAPTETQEKALD